MNCRFLFALSVCLLATAALADDHEIVNFNDQPRGAAAKEQDVKIKGVATFSGGQVGLLTSPALFPSWNTNVYFTTNSENTASGPQVISPSILTLQNRIHIAFSRKASGVEFDLTVGVPYQLTIGQNVQMAISDNLGHAQTVNIRPFDRYNTTKPYDIHHVVWSYDNIKSLDIVSVAASTINTWDFSIDNVDFDLSNNERYYVLLQGDTPTSDVVSWALVTDDTTLQLPFGARFDLKYQRRKSDGTWNDVNSKFSVTDATVTPPLPQTLSEQLTYLHPLWPNSVLFPFNDAVAETKKTFQVVHEGSATINVRPEDAAKGDPPLELAVSTYAAALGAPDVGNVATYDADVNVRAHLAGIPPQYIKAQIARETCDSIPNCFNPLTWRYEPLSRDYAAFHTDRSGIPTETKPYAIADNTYHVARGALVCPGAQGCPSDLNDDRGRIATNLRACLPGFLWAAPPPNVYPTARQYMQVNSGHLPNTPPQYQYPNQHWDADVSDPGSNPLCAPPGTLIQGRHRAVAAVPVHDPLNFVAQTGIASSYGLMQMMHSDIFGGPYYWKGHQGLQNPSLLFDTPENLIRMRQSDSAGKDSRYGGGSLKLGVMKDVYLFYRFIPWTGPTDIPTFASVDTFEAGLQTMFSEYNGKDKFDYGDDVVYNRAPYFLPQKKSSDVFLSVPCAQPEITAQTSGARIAAGTTYTLGIDVASPASAVYDWYLDSVNGSQRLTGDAASLIVQPLTTSTYHAVVSTTCGTVSSAPITVTVTGPCAPVITDAGVSDVTDTTASLAVATDSGASVAWVKDDSSSSLGGTDVATVVSNANPFVAPREVAAVNYHALVTNACGTVTSAELTVPALGNCATPSVTWITPPVTLVAGDSVPLSVLATGTAPLTYEWFNGQPGDTRTPMGTSAPNIQVSPPATSSFWVRVSNACGATQSSALTITVLPCTIPIVTQQPQSVSIVRGSSTSLHVAASGSSTFSYQWYAGASGDTSQLLPAATSDTVSVAPLGTTSYWVLVTNDCGAVDSSAAIVTVAASCVPPSITVNPESATISAGAPIDLSVSATGGGPLHYQWYLGSSGDTFAPIAGATASTLHITPSSSAFYWVRISGSCGFVDSMAAAVTVEACRPPVITAGPTSVSVQSGELATLAIAIDGSDPKAIQWYSGISGDLSAPVTGATSSSLQVRVTQTSAYWARVRNSCGTVDSATATVVVLPVCTPPGVVENPASTTITVGQFAILSVSVFGSTPLSYQWFVGEIGDESSPVDGAVGPVFTPAPQVTTSYWVEITNSCGVALSYTATVTVLPACVPPGMSIGPASSSVIQGDSVQLTVVASGTTPLTYAWYSGIAPDTSQFVGSTASITVSPSATTNYWVRVTNSCGSVDSATASVTVFAACVGPSVTATVSATTITAGDSATLSATASGTSPISVQWFIGSALDQSHPLGTGAEVVVSPTVSTSYWVLATTACGSAIASVSIEVVQPCLGPTIAAQPQSQSIYQGGSATLSTAPLGSEPFAYQWYAAGSPIPGATDASISVSPLGTTDYFVSVTNTCGVIQSDVATVTVNAPCGDCNPGPGPQPIARTALTPPSHLTAIPRRGLIVDLTWKGVEAIDGPVLYQIWRSDGGGPYSPIATVKSVMYHDRGMLKGKTYRYFAIATDASGADSSGPSNVATVTSY